MIDTVLAIDLVLGVAIIINVVSIFMLTIRVRLLTRSVNSIASRLKGGTG